MNFEKERLLIIAPHADDEILGCFGLIDFIKKNHGKVYVQVLTLGGYAKIGGGQVTKEKWKSEFLDACNFLKIDGYDIGYFDDQIRHLDTVEQSELIDLIEFQSKVSLSKIKPTVVAIPTIFSTHQDHIQAYKITMSALREHPNKTKILPRVVLSYESPEYYFWSAYSEFGRFAPNYYQEISKNSLKKKIKCLNFYKSQLRNGHRDGKKVTDLASIRGNEISTNFAESYHIHRMINL